MNSRSQPLFTMILRTRRSKRASSLEESSTPHSTYVSSHNRCRILFSKISKKISLSRQTSFVCHVLITQKSLEVVAQGKQSSLDSGHIHFVITDEGAEWPLVLSPLFLAPLFFALHCYAYTSQYEGAFCRASSRALAAYCASPLRFELVAITEAGVMIGLEAVPHATQTRSNSGPLQAV